MPVQGISKNEMKLIDLYVGFNKFEYLIFMRNERAAIYLPNDTFLQFITARNDRVF